MSSVKEETQEEYNERRMAALKKGIHTPEHGPLIRLAEMTDLHLDRTVKLARRHSNTSNFWRNAVPYFEAEVVKRMG